MPDSKLAIVRPLDFIWLLLFGGLALASPDRSYPELGILVALAVFQVVESRIAFFQTRNGLVIANTTKLLLGFLLIGYSGAIRSSYYLIALLPVVSAATTMGLRGTLMFTVLACGSYLIFLHPFFLDWDRYEITGDDIKDLSLRVIFLPVVGFLTYQLAEANRSAVRRYQAIAAKLTEANENLQQAEAAMRRSERLAALGQMSAGLAHELRNPLGTVKASAEMLAKSMPADNAVGKELTGFISSEVDRVNSLITRFLDFARPLKIRPEPNDLGETLDGAVAQLLRHNPPFKVAIYKNYSPDIRPFPFDAELIERVAYNLLLNAAQASPPDSAVTVKTRPVENFAEFSVIDRGSGVDPSNRESIFNPFFTTKREGVGLGLAIVAKIVDEHGGKITVESDSGMGSVFRVLLPVDPVEPPA
ncbi:MAG TPA: ATP-binding protein [Bryobacteraceae bacterium]|nr:ATP-binding protein [Bryobacteraceae bacterium]